MFAAKWTKFSQFLGLESSSSSLSSPASTDGTATTTASSPSSTRSNKLLSFYHSDSNSSSDEEDVIISKSNQNNKAQHYSQNNSSNSNESSNSSNGNDSTQEHNNSSKLKSKSSATGINHTTNNTNNSNNNGTSKNTTSSSSSSPSSLISSSTHKRSFALSTPFKLLQLFLTSHFSPSPSVESFVPMKKKTLVLDLDETLIHSSLHASSKRAYDMQIEVYIEKIVCLFFVYKRPYVDLFLNQISQWYNLVVFTASLRQYGDPVIDSLDLGRGILRQRLFRESCLQSNGNFMKDLTLVEPNLAHVCIIDNSPGAYALQPENGIPIATWLDDGNDEALLDLLPFLNALRFTGDVRSILGMRLR